MRVSLAAPAVAEPSAATPQSKARSNSVRNLVVFEDEKDHVPPPKIALFVDWISPDAQVPVVLMSTVLLLGVAYMGDGERGERVAK